MHLFSHSVLLNECIQMACTSLCVHFKRDETKKRKKRYVVLTHVFIIYGNKTLKVAQNYRQKKNTRRVTRKHEK